MKKLSFIVNQEKKFNQVTLSIKINILYEPRQLMVTRAKKKKKKIIIIKVIIIIKMEIEYKKRKKKIHKITNNYKI